MQTTLIAPENGAPEQQINVDATIAAMEQQFTPEQSAPELLVDALGIALGQIEVPEDQVRGLVQTSRSTLYASEED